MLVGELLWRGHIIIIITAGGRTAAGAGQKLASLDVWHRHLALGLAHLVWVGLDSRPQTLSLPTKQEDLVTRA